MRVVDDVPTAVNDVDAVTEDGPTVATGNVVSGVDGGFGPDANASDGAADTRGADGFGSIAWTGAVGNTVAGTYGTLTIDAAGNYSYQLNNSLAAVQGLSAGETLPEVFSYTLTDADGDTSPATLTITVNGANDGVTITGINATGGDEVVDEDDLGDGSSPNAGNLTQSGVFNISAPDGFDDLTIGGTAVVGGLGVVTLPAIPVPIPTTYGQLTITAVDLAAGTVSYSYTLSDNTTAHGPGNNGQNDVFDNIAVTLTDVDGSNAASSLIVRVVDDVPTAVNDVDAVTEDGPTVATGNVVSGVDGGFGPDANASDGAADTRGADGFGSIAWTGAVGNTVAGTYGTLTIDAAGNYSYQLNNSLAAVQGLSAGETLPEVFSYTLTDADGDTSPATLTITFTGDANSPTATSQTDTTNDTAATTTPARARPGRWSQVDTGSFAFNFGPDGPHATTPFAASYDGGLGTATQSSSLGVTTFTSAAWTLTINEVTGAYTFTQTAAYAHAPGAATDSGIVTVTIQDSDGSTVVRTLTLDIDDDEPTAAADVNGTENSLPVSANVLTNDDIGADHGVVGTDGRLTNIASINVPANTSGIAAGGSASIAGQYGSLCIDADGDYTYTPNISVPTGSVDTFTYTLTDGDGDTTTQTLTITFTGDANSPTAISQTDTTDDTAGDDGAPGSNRRRVRGAGRHRLVRLQLRAGRTARHDSVRGELRRRTGNGDAVVVLGRDHLHVGGLDADHQRGDRRLYVHPDRGLCACPGRRHR